MANILKKPDFAFIPSSSKESKAYSILPTNGDGDFTFYRNSTTTRVNKDGQLESWPNNIILNSNNLSTINVIGATRTINATIAPNGLQEGALIIEDSNYGYQHGLQSGIGQTLVTSTSAHHVSVYAKPYSNNRFLYFYFYFSDRTISFDMVTGAVVTSSTSFYNIKVEDAPYGWKRYSFNFTNQYTNQAGNFMVQGSPTNAYGLYFTGDGTSGIYLWGLQKTFDTQPVPYTPVGSTRLNLPTIDYTDGGPALLLNPERTNLFVRSENFVPNYTAHNSGISSNNIIAPDGTLTGTKFSENISTNLHLLWYQIPLVIGTVYTISMYVKKGTRRYCGLSLLYDGTKGTISFFDLERGILLYNEAQGSGYSVLNATINPVANGWYRITSTVTTGIVDSYPGLCLADSQWTSGTAYQHAYTGSLDYFYIWGAQLEVGLNASSYIPTIGATVTRVLEGGITNFIPKSNRVTVYAEFKLEATGQNVALYGFRPSGAGYTTSNIYYLFLWGADSNKFGFNTASDDSYGITNSTIANGKYHKVIAVFDYTNFANNELYIDGVKQTISQVRGTTPQITVKNNFSTLYAQGTTSSNEDPRISYREIYIWDTELTDAECIDLTSQQTSVKNIVNEYKQFVQGSGGVLETENNFAGIIQSLK